MKSSVSARFNADLLEEQYALWCADSRSVDPTWSAFFEGFELGVAQTKPRGGEVAAATPATGAAPAGENDLAFYGKVVSLVYNFRTLGHTQAHINPLAERPERNPRLALDQFGFSEADLEREASNPLFRDGAKMKLRDMVAALEATYAGHIGFEFTHIHNTTVRNWVRQRVEQHALREEDPADRKARALGWLIEADSFENFLGKKFLGEKRFSLEGGEGAMVVLNAILEKCPAAGVLEIEMGMAHRGRLNVLANFVRKSLTTILYEFTPNYEPDLVAGDGDVKYHLGYESVRELPDGKVRVSLAANPSHLEAVNAVVEGKARARQRILGDDGVATDRKRVLPILLHGDAAFAGQGSVAECLNLSQLPGYRTGGTIHLVINNQIGFTTMPADARSSAYATDVAKMVEAPILHVNGEVPMELYWAAQFALEFRQQFGRDVVIDMYCYRRQGHNETDQAAFTQPHIYRQIEHRPTIGQIYKKQLVDQGALTQAQADDIEKEIWDRFEAGHARMLEMQASGDRSVFSGSTAVVQPSYNHAPVPTGISRDLIQHVGKVLTTVPDGFNLHPTLAKRFIPRRQEALQQGGPIDWAFAESLAWGSLLTEGHQVRLSGQDCRRGTFSHRHAVFYDSETRARYIPLEHVSPTQAKFCVYNSFLSEFAVLGFDYGYSIGAPNMLTMWEAQFGDFSNGAQVIIDQFISSAESKWQTPTDLVLLLPHGYEGMGPEHSSARLERFLQLCADKNMVVGNFTTPAQYFHALRRQKMRGFRKPLVLMTPKSLLTRPEAVSTEADFLEGSCFQEVLPDPVDFDDLKKVERIVFCTGKVYYDLAAYRQEKGITNTAILRVEQLYPFHEELIEALVSRYPSAANFVWCQEEPMNMGAWSYISPRLEQVLGHRLRYAGRVRASSPAAGSKAMHYREQKALIDAAFTV
ncbi:MAG: 2-oxoglutarate dehydrogenase E1 component [Verrucomicrobia bacterium]|nr:MAG: 2-oxoglutarate dehydrogenase E1 component [Verrucomicrobiota bacterium]TAE85807.1 MAG: 2-oxoglutarate dehydrogenase E1 component [Verrucomicrobiota bacterium]TAF23228.1 MAG: 2-oxoglutarate dehydrogenase E1 component [Verrucomicrobiota bacterium]TAF40057.1 MAG: 2-oxoglutarate dehydrogenase E1 component [Verrucomicrobiota bacterium]